MATNNRRRDPGGIATETVMLGIVVVAFVLAVLVIYTGQHLGHAVAGDDVDVPGNPYEVTFDTIGGDLAWPPAGTWIVALLGGLVLAAMVAALVASSRRKKRRTRVDGAAAYMGRGRDIEGISKKNAIKTAERLGVDGSAGVPIGKTLSGSALFGTWEDMHADIWGPRTGKTTSRAIPAICDAPGGVLVTSNKRDVVDATRDLRATKGAVWVFDPQGIAQEQAAWWWDPLSYVTDEVKAGRLADHFAAANTGDKKDSHFEDNGRDLLAGCLLAAAIDGRPITAVYTWLTRPTDEKPSDIVREGGYPLTADQLRGFVNAPEKERGSIYSTARRMAACLTYRHVAAWVTPTPAVDGEEAPEREHFDPAAFVRSDATLYSLSKEGVGSAGPLVMALTAAVVEAAEELAVTMPGGRLSKPLLGVLDEAANVCRWRGLPDLYSHYGSRGIVLMTILQSWSQGVDVWGQSGMRKLWSASNVKVYGGGVSEDDFLESLSKLVGDYDRMTSSVSSGRGGRSVSRQLTRERILGVDELGAMPKGRAVVLSSGNRPTLVRTQPWQKGPYAEQIKASIRAHDPMAERTIREGEEELQAVEEDEAVRQEAS